MSNTETAACRGCGKELNGPPYYKGRLAGQLVYDPVTKQEAKINYYGGYVCSEACDYNASLELERSMPGHIGQKRVGQEAERHIRNNWNK